MVSRIEEDDFDFENAKYRPQISSLRESQQIYAHNLEGFMRSNTLERRVVWMHQFDGSTYSTYAMDNCLEITIPSNSVREEKVKYWEEKHNAASKWAWISGSGAVLSTIGAAAAAVLIPTPHIAVALLVAAAVGTIFCIIKASAASNASHQIKGWSESPLEKLAKRRVEAYEKGFPYVYNNNLKLQGTSNYQILHPVEVQLLFERHFDNFYTTLLPEHPSTEKKKKEWMD